MKEKNKINAEPSTSFLSRLWYEIGIHTPPLLFTLGFSMRVKGRHNVPQTGPLMVIANHQSYFDPVAIGVAVRRHMVFLARKSLFNNPFFGKLIASYNAVPIDQEG